MAIDQQGIMALPEGQQAIMPELSYDDSYDAMRQALQQTHPEADIQMQSMLDNLRGTFSEISDDQLSTLIEAIQQLYDNPETYEKEVAALIKSGALDVGDLPEKYDEEFLSVVLTVLRDEKRTRMMESSSTAPMEMMLPQNFALGGIAEAARIVASKGRRGDTMLAHITPKEARLLKSRGGAGTINPATGLPEYNILSDIWKGVKGVFKRVTTWVKDALKTPIGRILGTIAIASLIGPQSALALSAPTAAAVASGAVTAITGGDFKNILISAATGYFGAPGSPVSQFAEGAIKNQFLRDVVVGTGIGTAAGMLQGQKFRDAVKGGLTSGVISGGLSYLQNRGNIQTAKADAEDAAFKKASADVELAPPPKPSVIDSKLTPSETPGLFVKTETFTDGRVIQQMVDGRGSPIGPQLPVSPGTTAGIEGAKFAAISQGAPTPAPMGTTSYLDAVKQNTISRSMGVPTAPTPAQVANIPTPEAASFNAFQDLRSVTPAAPTAGIPSVLDTGAYRYTGGPPRPMPATSASVAGAPKQIMAGAPYQTTTPDQYSTPGVGTSISTMGRGAKDFLSGDFSKGAKTFMEGAEDLFFPGPSKEDIAKYAKENKMSFSEADKALSPPWYRTYGPGVAAITGIGALTGAFKRDEPPESEFAKRMRAPIDLSKNPKAYYIQDIPGAIYDEQGAIIGTRGLPPPLSMADITYTTPSYTGYAPRYADGGVVSATKAAVEAANEAVKSGDYEQNARKYIVQDLPGVRYGESGTIAEAGVTSGTPAQRITLESVRAPVRSYSGYQSKFPSPPSPASMDEQTANLFKQYVGSAPTPDQLSYWSGIFGLDNQITADEIERMKNAANITSQTRFMNMGGIAALRQGGYPRRTGQISGPGTETSDSIPAMLSDGEFVMTARAVRGMGNGSRRDGARKMYALMHKLERNAARG